MTYRLLLSSAAVLGLTCVSAPVLAVGIQNVVSITGYYQVWESDGLYSPPGGLTRISPPAPPLSLATYLQGDLSAPGSNIELGNEQDLSTNTGRFAPWLGGALATVLTGDFGGADQVILSSLTRADWEANDYRLTKDYVIAAAATAGVGMTDADLDADCDPSAGVVSCKSVFVTAPVPGLGGVSHAFRISDPNISFVNLVGGNLDVGLSATLDSTAFLQSLLPGVPLTPPKVASEVVMVEWQGQRYAHYGFKKCIDSRQDAGDGPNHAENSYSCTISEPGTLALFALGTFGVGWLGRRRPQGSRRSAL